MRLVSVFNPLSKSDSNVPVAIFCFGQKCKFLTLSESYEETLESACDAFDIDSLSVHMRTSALDVCKGRSIDIDPSVYAFIWTVLDEIELVLDEGGGTAGSSSGRKGKSGNALEKIVSRSPTLPSKRVPPVVVVEPGSLAGPSKLPSISKPSREFLDSSSDSEGHFEPHVVNDKGMSHRTAGIEGTGKKFKPVVSMPALAAPREVEPAPTVEEKVQEPVSKPKEDTDSATINEDVRFDITINGPQPGQVAQFKTRGPHTVKKVLSAACKTFNIKYENACLFLIVPLQNEDGEVENHNFECDAGDTMAMCGISTQSKLVVRLKKPGDVGDEGFTDDAVV